VITENTPSSAGAVLWIACSDQCRYVLKPQALANLRKSSLHLPASYKPRDDPSRIGIKVGAQQGLGLKLSFRVADQDPAHRGTAGKPVLYQTDLRETTSTLRLPLPYQSATVMVFQVIAESSATTERLGKREPFRRGRPSCPRRRGGAGSHRERRRASGGFYEGYMGLESLRQRRASTPTTAAGTSRRSPRARSPSQIATAATRPTLTTTG
jgi:hypothetical protein